MQEHFTSTFLPNTPLVFLLKMGSEENTNILTQREGQVL